MNYFFENSVLLQHFIDKNVVSIYFVYVMCELLVCICDEFFHYLPLCRIFLAFEKVSVRERRFGYCNRLVSLRHQITQTRLKCNRSYRPVFLRAGFSARFPHLFSPAITVVGHYLSKGLPTNYGFSTTLREETHKEIN